MKANILNRTIEMTKTEAKNAGKLGTEDFKTYVELSKMFPNFEIVIKSRTTAKECYKGLTYKYMRAYIESYDKDHADSKKMDEFEKLLGYKNGKKEISFVEHSYGEIKMWFLDTFPDVEKVNKDNDEKLKEIKNKRAEARKKVA